MTASTRSAHRVSQHERYRRGRGLSIVELARVLGVSHSYVSKIERGRARASASYRRAFARACRVRASQVFDLANGRVLFTDFIPDGSGDRGQRR